MSRKLNYKIVAATLLVGILGWTVSANAASPGLSIIQRDAKTDLNTCINNAAQVMQKRKFDNVKIIDTQVSGSTQGYTVAILCYLIKASEKAVLQSIIVSGFSTEEAEKLRNELVQKLSTLDHINQNTGATINQNADQLNDQFSEGNTSVNQSDQDAKFFRYDRTRFGGDIPKSLPGNSTTLPPQ